MARSYGVLKVSVWEPGSEFRRLSPLAQWAYTMLLSQPQVSNLGVLPYTPEKWARFAAGLTLQHLEEALQELADTDFVIIDVTVGELLVRTFIKHDKVWSQPKLVTNARKLIRETESAAIHTYLTMRHPWLVDASSRPEIEAYEAAAERGIETPSDRGIADTPSVTPSDTRFPPTRAQDVRASRAPAGAGPGPGVGGTSAAKEQEQLQELGAAAAENGHDLEAPREATITAVAKRYGADPTVLEPDARQLPAVLFDDVAERVAQRIATGNVTNPAGYLIKLTRRARTEAAKRQAHDQAAAHTIADEIVFDAQSYARGQHPWPVAQELLERKLTRHDIDGDQRIELLEQAADAYRETLTPVST